MDNILNKIKQAVQGMGMTFGNVAQQVQSLPQQFQATGQLMQQGYQSRQANPIQIGQGKPVQFTPSVQITPKGQQFIQDQTHFRPGSYFGSQQMTGNTGQDIAAILESSLPAFGPAGPVGSLIGKAPTLLSRAGQAVVGVGIGAGLQKLSGQSNEEIFNPQNIGTNLAFGAIFAGPKATRYNTAKGKFVGLERKLDQYATQANYAKKFNSFKDFNISLSTGGPGDAKLSQTITAIRKDFGSLENFWRVANGKEPKISSQQLGLNSQPWLKTPPSPLEGGVNSVPKNKLPQEKLNPQVQQNQVPLETNSKVPQVGPSLAGSLPQDTRNIINGANLKVKKLVGRMQGSEKYPPELRQMLEGTYVPQSNQQTITNAKKLVKLDPTAAETRAMNPQNAVDQAIGAELFNYHMDKGSIAKANEVLNATAGTNEGQMIQILSQYDKTTPQGAIKFAQSAVKEYNATHANNPLRLTDANIKDIYATAKKVQGMPEGRERNIAANDLINQVNNLIPSSIWDKAITVWKAGLLTSLRTHERNLLGNILHGVAEVAKDPFATIADKAMSLKTGQRTQTTTLQGMGSGIQKGWQATKDVVTKGYDPEEMINKYDVRHITWGNNLLEKGLKIYTNAVFRTLGAADKPFWNASFARSLYDQAGAQAINAGKRGDRAFIKNLVDNATPEMKGLATKDANVAVFKDQTKLSDVAKLVQGLKVGGIPVGQIVVPFTGVPSSIAGQMVAYSPLGLIKGAMDVGRVLMTKESVPLLQRQASQEIGRGVIGSGLFGIGAFLMSKGLMTGQPKDAAEAAQWQLENKPYNSVLINGQWRGIGSVGPENLVLLAGAKYQAEMSKPDASIGAYGASIGKDFASQTMLQGIGGPLNAVTDPNRYGTSYLGNQAASVVPNAVKDYTRSRDSYVRENNTLLDYFSNSLPGRENRGIIKRDNLGNPIPQEPTGAGAFVDLLNSKTPISNPVVDELARLNNAGNNATPGKLNKSQTIQGQKITLTPQQLNSLEAELGPQVTQALGQLFTMSGYKNLSDEEKGKSIDSIISATRKKVRGTTNLQTPSATNSPITSSNPSVLGGPVYNLDGSPRSQTSTTGEVGGQYMIINPETGSVKTIDLSKPITEPTLTGLTELDRKAISAYNSDITSRINDLYALYVDKKLTADQVNTQIAQLKDQTLTMDKYGNVTKGAKGSKPKKLKITARKAPGFKKIAQIKPKKIKVKAIKFASKAVKNAQQYKVKQIKVKNVA